MAWLFSSNARAERGDRGGRGGVRRRVRRASRVRTTSAQHDACSRASPRPRVAISADAASSGTSLEAREAFPSSALTQIARRVSIVPRAPSDGRTSTARVETGPGAKSVERRSRIRVLIDTSRRSKKYLSRISARPPAPVCSRWITTRRDADASQRYCRGRVLLRGETPRRGRDVYPPPPSLEAAPIRSPSSPIRVRGRYALRPSSSPPPPPPPRATRRRPRPRRRSRP